SGSAGMPPGTAGSSILLRPAKPIAPRSCRSQPPGARPSHRAGARSTTSLPVSGGGCWTTHSWRNSPGLASVETASGGGRDQQIKPVVRARDKAGRVHAFSVSVENGSFRLKGASALQVDPGQQALFDEKTTFPLGERDDLLDAAATGTPHLLDRPEVRVW